MKRGTQVSLQPAALTLFVLLLAAPLQAQISTESLHQEALQALAAENYDEAVRILRVLVEEQPYNTVFLYDLGRAEKLSRDTEAAVSTLKQLFRIDPAHESGAALRAGIFAEQGEWQEALQVLLPFSDSSKSYEVSHLLAEVYRRLHQPVNAAWYYEKAVHLNPNATQDFVRLGQLYLERDLPALSIRSFESAINLGHQDPATHYQLATAYYQVGRALGKIEVLPLAHAVPESTRKQWYVLEAIEGEPNRYRVTASNSAIYHLQKAFEMGFNAPGLRLLQADIWFEAKQYQRARDIYEAILDLVPRQELAGYHYRFGLTLFWLKDIKAFQEHLDKAVELDYAAYKPKLQEAYAMLADHYCLRGNLDRYIHYLELAVNEGPRSIELRYKLTNALAEAGRVPEAVAQGRVVLQLDPYHPDRPRLLKLVNYEEPQEESNMPDLEGSMGE